jgi:hypothetical protein
MVVLQITYLIILQQNQSENQIGTDTIVMFVGGQSD